MENRKITYNSWYAMKHRCYSKKDISYKNYGGRGIRVCKRWLHSFDDFIADMGSRPSSKYSIERKNNNGNYTPSNCVWATGEEQHQNKRTSFKITYNGKTMSLSKWGRLMGIPKPTLFNRYRAKWPIDKILKTKKDFLVTFNGQSLTCAQWAKKLKMKKGTLHFRLKYSGWSIEKSLTKPVRKILC